MSGHDQRLINPEVNVFDEYPELLTLEIVRKLVASDRSRNKHLSAKVMKGIVLAGTGLGHVSTMVYESIERAIKEGLTIVMAVQTLHGFTGMNVYSTGRELLNYGIIPAKNMLPETAYVKLGWVLGQTDDPEEIKTLLLENIAGEFVDREIPIAFNYNIDELLKNKKL